VNTFPSESYTRMSQTPERRRSRFDKQDDQFESELPPEIRAELASRGGRPARFVSRPPRRPGVSAPPPRPVSSRANRYSWVWWLLAALIGVLLLLARLSEGGRQTQPQVRPVEVQSTPPTPKPVEVRRAVSVVEIRRALPAVLRALPIDSVSSPIPTIGWQRVRMPNGSIVDVHYEGDLPSAAKLPPRGHYLGQTYSTGRGATWWIWMQPAGTNVASWVDP
jgi:hypothetical protein